MNAGSRHPNPIPRRAMVLAAGLGERLRPITDSRPKPLVQVRGHALLDLILDHLETEAISEVVINLHYLGPMIESHLRDRPQPPIVFSREETLLDTGGGVRKALPFLGAQAFFVINGDVCWLDGRTPALARLAQAWDGEVMDALLLLHPVALAVGYNGRGDFFQAPDGRLRRRGDVEAAPFVFTGLQILHPRLFEAAPAGHFSLNLLYDTAGAADRLRGLRHDGEWFHIGTPEQLNEVEKTLPALTRAANSR